MIAELVLDLVAGILAYVGAVEPLTKVNRTTAWRARFGNTGRYYL